ncbi:MAG: hypothetical protein IKP47_07185 [Ruminococcus sp.]|nr:hypothetical protein [Ruminococcus sp.]
MKMRRVFAGFAATLMAASMAMVAAADYTIPKDYVRVGKKDDVNYLGDPDDTRGQFKVAIYGGDDYCCWPKIYTNKEDLKDITNVKVKINYKKGVTVPEGNWCNGVTVTNDNVLGWNDGRGTWEYDPAKDSDEFEWKTSYKKLFKDNDSDYVQILVNTYFDKEQDWNPDVIDSVEFTLVGANAPSTDPVWPEGQGGQTEQPTDGGETQQPTDGGETQQPTDGGDKKEETPKAGAAAGIALAGLAVAGAAFVATKRR